MSNIPKELQSAYQRWEMNSFGDNRPSTLARQAQTAPAAPEVFVPVEPLVVLPTEEECDAIREQARADGFEQGREEGYAEGVALARAEAVQELEHMRAIAVTFGEALSAADETIANDVLELALNLARGMLRTALDVKPELILPVIREAIGYLPVFQQPARIMLNPQDAELVNQAMGEELAKSGWHMMNDPSIARGGCKVDTPHNQIDAQAEARWQRLSQALGKNVEWLEQGH